MRKRQKFSLKKRLISFKYAFAGLKTLVIEEHNSRIHLVSMFLVIICGIYFKVSILEWIILVISISAVIALELVNSAIENLVDHVSLDIHERLKNAKDMAAAAVLVAAVSSVIVGMIIFIPKIITVFNG